MFAARKRQLLGITMSDYSSFLRIELFTPDDFQSSITAERKQTMLQAGLMSLGHYWNFGSIINDCRQCEIISQGYLVTVDCYYIKQWKSCCCLI